MFRYPNRLLFALISAISLIMGASLPAFAQQNLSPGVYAKMDTAKGTIILQLDYQKAPLASINFAGLAEGKLGTTRGKGTHFYDGLTFHRVVKEPKPFVIQGGDPNGNGTGGPGYTWPDEIVPGLNHDSAGVLSMANSGPDTNGSQFFITLAPAPFLDGHYTVFGHVVSGMDVVNKIEKGDVIKKVTILRIGPKAQSFDDSQQAFDTVKARILQNRQAAAADTWKKDLAIINKKWPNATVAPDNIRYIVQKPGSGARPTKGEVVKMDYTASLLDGTEFDSSSKSGAITFPVGVGAMRLKGWDQMAMDMKPGEKRLVILPSDVAFGAAGVPGSVPPQSTVVLDLTLLSVTKK